MKTLSLLGLLTTAAGFATWPGWVSGICFAVCVVACSADVCLCSDDE